MSKEKIDPLFGLIKSLKKSEKRYFKLFAAREGEGKDKKFIRLFDFLDRQNEFNETAILEADKSIKPRQLSNLKAHLYKRIMQSLRLYNASMVKDVQIRELIDYAQLLFNRSLYDQCVQILNKAKKLAYKHENLELLLEIFKWEKTVLAHTVGKHNQARVNNIIENVSEVNQRINNINRFSNISVKLNSLYLKTGFIRSESDYDRIQNILHSSLPDYDEEKLSVSEKCALYELHVGYYFFLQDFDQAYQYAKKWVALYDKNPEFIPQKLDNYIRSINNLMIGQYKLTKYHEFVEMHKKLKAIKSNPDIVLDENIGLKLLKYTYVHEFNRYFMLGDFDSGVILMNRIKPGLEEFIDRMDRHSRLILYYKIACLYFGNENFNESIHWLNKIINTEEGGLREDVLCFARILNLISHFELGNTDVIEYYLRSTYRFLSRKDDLHNYQKYILNFMKGLTRGMSNEDFVYKFKDLRKKLLPLVNSPYEKRAFIYFDIISWLESKIEDRPIKTIIKEKALKLINMDKAA